MNAPLRPIATRSWFDWSRQEMLDAWRLRLRSLSAEEAREEIAATENVMRQLLELEHPGA